MHQPSEVVLDAATTLADMNGIVGQRRVPHVLTAVKALATLAPAACQRSLRSEGN